MQTDERSMSLRHDAIFASWTRSDEHTDNVRLNVRRTAKTEVHNAAPQEETTAKQAAQIANVKSHRLGVVVTLAVCTIAILYGVTSLNAYKLYSSASDYARVWMRQLTPAINDTAASIHYSLSIEQLEAMQSKMERISRELDAELDKLESVLDYSELKTVYEETLRLKHDTAQKCEEISAQLKTLADQVTARWRVSFRTCNGTQLRKLGDRCVYLSGSESKNFSSASQFCNQIGGYLSTVFDKNDVEQLSNLSKQMNMQHPYVGLQYKGTDLCKNGSDQSKQQWQWIETREKINTTLWKPDEPNHCDSNDVTAENCVHLVNDSGLNDTSCSQARHFICTLF